MNTAHAKTIGLSASALKVTLGLLLVVLLVPLGVLSYRVYFVDSVVKVEEIEEMDELNKDTYSAIFLENGQVYFGKILKNTDLEIQLTGVYFLRVDQVTAESETQEETTEAKPQLTLVRRSQTLHSPSEPMTINKAHVILTEPLSPESDVISAIKQIEAEDTQKETNE